jgi:hypothetical protein
MIPLTILSLDTDETVRNLSIEFSVALLRLVARLFMFLDSIVKGIITTIYQVSVHLAKLFQRRLLEIDQPETKIAYGGYVC